ncbi:sialate O-acetylesterase [Muriicola sp. Z0-33]|uniref:sialate O-acetylesterase n=1 Tax=Muriicola sp. Z0-33 TaxID=2816957 RepID=UPI0022380323|nr:sialate O-acetylesterase [Muriicola sp. Z0-33]MCW5516423.1 beta galactosidase jelly roll domain-containing protein [Muriicola sp. Z0-33]
MTYCKDISYCLKKTSYLLAFWLLPFGISAQTFEVAKIFSDHMVLQRDANIPVWGEAASSSNISVFFNGKEFKTKASPKGNWEVTLPKLPAGGPYEMSIVSNTTTVDFTDIMIGDVWLCSGQSNMEWVVANSNNSELEIKNGNHPNIRHFKVPHSSASFPEDKLADGEWETASSETLGNFTAVGYFFAREIQKSENVPIGLLNSSWGGSRIEPWIRAEDLGFDDPEEMAAQLEAKIAAEKAEFIAQLKEKLSTIPEEDLGMKNEDALWAKKNYDDSQWEAMELPSLWEERGWENTDGIFWFRKTILLPKGVTASDGILSLGAIDDNDQTWVNGHLVGSTNAYNENRVYEVPSKYLREGKNTITVRVDDTGGGGGIYGDSGLMFFEANKVKTALHGDWKYKVGMINMNAAVQGANQQPTLLYNKMIHPILRFPIKGALWYQGESNAGNAVDAKTYTTHFKTLISSWRTLWNVGDFPFLYVQLANFMAAEDHPGPSNWALLRESQSNALELPYTGQAVIIDIGEANDIHPRNKQDVGKRLALAAQKMAYNKEVVYSGPQLNKTDSSNSKITLHFDHIGSGLVTKDNGPLKGFAIAGADKKFVWAEAKIEGNTIEVWSPDVASPVAVRYAWADNPDKANLYNKEGLPASPFRTDNWEE